MTTGLNARAIAILASFVATANALSAADCQKIRVLSLDVTGTLLATKEPVIHSYHKAALWSKLPDPPSAEELKAGFKAAYKERCIESPCFGGAEGISGREWWYETVRRVLYKTGREYRKEDYDRYFRRVYQHFGSPGGYRVLEDAQSMIDALSKKKETEKVLLGITSNTPTRHMESVLPMLDSFHDNFHFFTCSQDVGIEKPEAAIFEKSYQEAKFWIPDLQKDEILHIGDSYACDYCGAKAYGFQALMLDRSDNPAVIAYQDWVKAPDYPGKTLEEVQDNTITSLEEVVSLLATVANSEVRKEKDESEAIKPRVSARGKDESEVIKPRASVREEASRQEQIKPHKAKPAGKPQKVPVKVTVVEDPSEADTNTDEEEPAEAAGEQAPYSPNSSEPTVGFAGVDDLTAKFDERRPQYRQPTPTLRFNSLGEMIEDDVEEESEPEEVKATYVAAVEEFGYQVQQQYSTDSWFDAKSKVTASTYKSPKQENTPRSTRDRPTTRKQPARTETAYRQPTNWFDNQSKVESSMYGEQTQDDSKAPYNFSDLYSNPKGASSNPLEDFRDIKSPPIYGTKKTKLRSARKTEEQPREAESLQPKMDRDIASGQHLSNQYADDYSHDDFRDIQSPPIYGEKITNVRSARKSEEEPGNEVETPKQKADRDIASGRHLSNKYFDDYSEDDFRDIQSPPVY